MAYNYPYGNGQQLNLDWFLNEWKNLLAAWEAEKNGIEGALQAEIDRAEAALADVFAARDAAAQSAANALESKNAAAQSASDASGYLATVRADANTASNAAQNAAQSESNAGDSASAAAQSKTAAQNAARAAADSQTAAGNSASAAADSQTAAGNSASAAADSQTAAGNSASAAAQSASDAEDAASSVEASAQQIATNTSDINNLKESMNDKAPIIVNNASGVIAHFTDGADDIPIKALTIEGVETAIITRTGKNLLNTQRGGSSNGITCTINNDGSVAISGTAESDPINIWFIGGYGNTYQILKVYAGETVTVTDAIIYYHYDNEQLEGFGGSNSLDNTGSETFTFEKNGWIDGVRCPKATAGTTYDKTIYPQLEIGYSATDFESYQSRTFEYPSESINTLYGVNNFWSDSGDVNITYCADTKIYIDNKITKLQAIILENIGG